MHRKLVTVGCFKLITKSLIYAGRGWWSECLNALKAVFRAKNKARKTFAPLALIILLKIILDFYAFTHVKLATNKIDTLPDWMLFNNFDKQKNAVNKISYHYIIKIDRQT